MPFGPPAEAVGSLTVMLPPGNEGPGRTLVFGNGAILETVLEGGADIAKPVGAASMGEALGVTPDALANAGDPRVYVLKVVSEAVPSGGATMCGDTPVTHVLDRDPEGATDRSVTLAFLTAPPTDPSATVCKRLVYMRG